jgi:hypothetical protein
MTLSQALYILNPAAGETVVPTDLSSSNPYADNEYLQEFGIPVTSATVQTTNSVSNVGVGSGPLFKWVRVTPATEASLGLDVNNDHYIDPVSPLYYDPTHLSVNGTVKPGLVTAPPLPPAVPLQALEVTALAVIQPNTRKLLQYVVVPGTVNLNFPAGLTLAGNNVVYKGPAGANSALFSINGNDNTVSRTCTTPLASPVPYAIGYTNGAAGDTSQANIVNGTSPNPGNYTGMTPPTPSVGLLPLPLSMQRPSSLDSLVQTITESADVLLSPVLPAPSVTGSQLPSAMNSSYPMTIVINGDLDLTGWHNAGYGLLLVTGNLIYDPGASWYGIVLVIGKGQVAGGNAGVGRIQGAMFVAQTRDPLTGSLLADPNLGAASVDFSSLNPTVVGVGIFYDSCSINTALRPTTYQVLSFREIPLN